MRKQAAPPERIPPQSIEAERAALGAAMQSTPAARDLVKSLRCSDYYQDKHDVIHAAIESTLLCGGHVDLLTVGTVLHERHEFEEVGGNYLAALVDETPSPSHHADYIRIVKQKAVARRVIRELTRSAERVRANGTIDPQKTESTLRKKWGTDYSANMAAANFAASRLGLVYGGK